jgi:ClpP class serine protease
MPHAKSSTGCYAEQLFGDWFMDAAVLQGYKDRVAQIDLVALAARNAELRKQEEQARQEEMRRNPNAPPPKLYALHEGVGMVTISGPTTKYDTSFGEQLGGTSTTGLQRSLRQMRSDFDKGEVKACLIHIEDAPGGTAAGTPETHADIRKTAAKMPTRIHITDQATSAAYFMAAGGQRITANKNAYVGGIGTFSSMTDSSAKWEKEGVKNRCWPRTRSTPS